MPYILPKMHDRYFFPADVLSIVFAFYWPRYWYVPIVMGTTSLLAYAKFLLGGVEIVPLSWLPVAPLAFIAVLGREFLLIFGRNFPECRDRKG